MNLSHNGKAHRALRYLSNTGPATIGELRYVLGLTGNEAKKVAFMFGMLRDRGLVSFQRGLGYQIEPSGDAALAALEAGSDYEIPDFTPRVRVFARNAA